MAEAISMNPLDYGRPSDHVVQTMPGRYIMPELLDQYIEMRFKTAVHRRTTKEDHYIVIVPEKLHQVEIQYLQKASQLGRLIPNHIPTPPPSPPLSRVNSAASSTYSGSSTNSIGVRRRKIKKAATA